MMLEFEGLFTFRAFEFPQHCTFIMAYHVALQAVDIGECFTANFARLKIKKIAV